MRFLQELSGAMLGGAVTLVMVKEGWITPAWFTVFACVAASIALDVVVSKFAAHGGAKE